MHVESDDRPYVYLVIQALSCSTIGMLPLGVPMVSPLTDFPARGRKDGIRHFYCSLVV